MTELFGRAYELTIGTRKIVGLRVSFEIEKSLSREPNTAKIGIYNLSQDTRDRIAFQVDAPVQLRAGYGDELEDLFLGDATNITSEYSAPDWITTVESGDGVNAIRRGRISRSFAPGTKIKEILKAAAECAGAKIGNALKKADAGDVAGTLQEFSGGRVLSGQCFPKLNELAGSLGYGVSIQNGELQLLALDETTTDQVVVLDAETGLIGSPHRSEKGRWQAVSLLHPGLAPGRRVKIRATEIEGIFRVEQTKYTGDTHGEAWFAELEVKSI